MRMRATFVTYLLLAAPVACGVGAVPTAPGDDGEGAAPDARTGEQDDDTYDTGAEMLAAFTSCMRYDDWLTSRLDELPYQLAYPDGGGNPDECFACHEAPGAGAYLGRDPVTTYRKHRSVPSIYKIALPIVEDGEPRDVIPNDRYLKKGQEPTQHPDFVLSQHMRDGLDLFFERTSLRFQAEGASCLPDEP